MDNQQLYQQLETTPGQPRQFEPGYRNFWNSFWNRFSSGFAMIILGGGFVSLMLSISTGKNTKQELIKFFLPSWYKDIQTIKMLQEDIDSYNAYLKMLLQNIDTLQKVEYRNGVDIENLKHNISVCSANLDQCCNPVNNNNGC